MRPLGKIYRAHIVHMINCVHYYSNRSFIPFEHISFFLRETYHFGRVCAFVHSWEYWAIRPGFRSVVRK